MFTSTIERTLRNPSATKTGPGRRHVSGHKKASGKIRRNGKLGSGWMHQRLMRHFAEQVLQKIAEKQAKVALRKKARDLLVAPYPKADITTDAHIPVVFSAGSSIGSSIGKTETLIASVTEQVIIEPVTTLPDDENRIFLVIRENPGASIKLIGHWMPELSETQIERRLKKLREAGHIRYDKSAKGWFVA